jgi:hypothetical protein
MNPIVGGLTFYISTYNATNTHSEPVPLRKCVCHWKACHPTLYCNCAPAPTSTVHTAQASTLALKPTVDLNPRLKQQPDHARTNPFWVSAGTLPLDSLSCQALTAAMHNANYEL